ncbi:hypothetical protein FA13DRAFT_1754744 [Coprinellus micaceus]|uniref:Extracellular metalloproteinase n=1 Tax=Coprinellus micaceus TaxID=71717 RepID=A0A4Y7TCN7_COPMI|nr:hypothetical protein FA13DRAFT_1754744 [Coprinellus micaceus]
MANDVVVHELTHGITNRPTGGGTAACLQTLEARGLGEGWSDAVAEHYREMILSFLPDGLNKAALLSLTTAGLRTYPYSIDLFVSPPVYATFWANILHNVYAALVQAHGWSSTAFTDPDTAHDNAVFMRLLFDALSFQPCNPTAFVSARDARIEADDTHYAGAHYRGLGVTAANFVDDASVPAGC